jgi:MerR family Zn(II)-responsive transcriptional regulator of zntA
MQIGEVADRVGIATSAIRFYEDKGLIPEPQRTDAGYRDYDPAVVDRIRFIRAGQAVGLTLRELNQVLQIRDEGESPCRHVTDLLDIRIHDVEQRIEELQTLRRDLTAMRRNANRLDPADCPPESVCRIVTALG